MINRDYHHAGHSPRLSAAFFHFDVCLMVSTLPAVPSAQELHDNAAKKALTVPLPRLALAFPGLVDDAPADLTAPKRPSKVGPPIVPSEPLLDRLHGPDSDPQAPQPGVVITLTPKCCPPDQPRTAGHPGTDFGVRI